MEDNEGECSRVFTEREIVEREGMRAKGIGCFLGRDKEKKGIKREIESSRERDMSRAKEHSRKYGEIYHMSPS